MSSEIELLPCPFCGVIPKFERVDGRMSDPNGSEFWGVICRSGKNVGGACEVNVPARRSKESAAKAWNTRAAPPELAELQATIAQLRSELERLKGGQGEPVAWQLDVEGYKTVTMDNYQRALSEQEHFQGRGRTAVVHSLYRSQPAPVSVAVDLNDAEEFEKWWRTTPILRKGKLQIAQEAWKARACLDKVKELNQ